MARAQAGAWADAERLLVEVTQQDADDVQAWLHLANARMKLGKVPGAVDAALRAFDADTSSMSTCEVAVDMLFSQHRFAEALDVMQRLAPQTERGKSYYANLGSALIKLDRHQEAVPALLKAIQCEMHWPLAHFRLGIAFKGLHMHEEAAESLRTTWVLCKPYTEALEQSVHQAMHACHWTQLAEDLNHLESVLNSTNTQSSQPFCLIALPLSPRALLASARAAAAVARATVKQPLPPIARVTKSAKPATPAGTDCVQRPLRIGYVSNDFRNHATAVLMVEMLERRNPLRTHVTLYSHSPNDGSAMEKRIRAACDRFVDIGQMSDLEAAQRIRADGIDILVDLKGHTSDHRLPIFAYRPAPIQASYLGFPGTSGASFIDYVIGDPVVTPASSADDFSEKIAQLPVCYQPNDRSRPLPAALTREQCGLPADAFVMASFNQNYKITPEVFDTWCDLLRDIPHAVLWLMRNNAQAEKNLRRQAVARGIDPERIVFAAPIRLELHLARLQAADVFVDTTPCSAHTTASDALWIGLPVVSVTGQTFASRVAGSLLHAVGLPQLAVPDLQRYAEVVRGLAANPQELARIREHLVNVRMSTPLFDSERIARDMEALYERIAERHAAGLAPDHLLA